VSFPCPLSFNQSIVPSPPFDPNLFYYKGEILTIRLYPSPRLDYNLLPLRAQQRHPLSSLYNPGSINQHRRLRQRNLEFCNRSSYIFSPRRWKRLGRMGHEKKSSREIKMDYLFFDMVLCTFFGIDWDYCDWENKSSEWTFLYPPQNRIPRYLLHKDYDTPRMSGGSWCFSLFLWVGDWFR
jgi:hypothetical protein